MRTAQQRGAAALPWTVGLVVATALAGCMNNGGGDGAPVNASAASGIWRGTFTSSYPQGQPLEVLGLISEDGEAHFVFTTEFGKAMAGIFAFSSGPFANIAATVYRPDGTHPLSGAQITGTATLSGELNSRRTMWGTYTTPSETGTIDQLAYDGTDYEQASALPFLARTWSFTSRVYSIALPLSSSGVIANGADSAGCGYSGRVALIDPALNAYRVRLTVSGCGIDGEYSGLGALVTDPQPPNDTLLLLALSGPARNLDVLLRR